MKMSTRERLKRVSRINRPASKFPQIEAEQWDVENFYKEKFKLSKIEMQNLHMFFSPLIVQRGLTKKQVRFCINLYASAQLEKDRDEKVIEALRQAVQSYTGFFAEVLGHVLKRKLWVQKEFSKVPIPPK